MARKFRSMLIPVFSTTVFGYCIFAILSFMGQNAAESYNFFVAFVCAVVSAVINLRFSLRERSLVSVFALNGILIVLTVFLVFAASNNIEGFWPHAIACICVAAPILHGFLLTRNSVSLNTMLLYCEFSIVGTAVLLALQLGDMTVPPVMNGISVAALILNLFMLASLRVSGPAKKTEGGRKTVERGALLAGGLVGIIFAAVLVAVLLLPVTRGAIFTAADATGAFFVMAGEAIERFFFFLFSLFPQGAAGGAAGGGTNPGVQGGGDSSVAINWNLSPYILIACAVLAVVIIAVLFRRLRKKKLEAVKPPAFFYEEDESETLSLSHALQALRALAARFRAWLYFQKCRASRRGTYEEAFLRISRRAKRRGFRRGAAETPHAYLCRIAALLPSERDTGGPSEQSLFGLPEQGLSRLSEPRTSGPFAELLGAISAAVDVRLYSGESGDYVSVTVSEAETLSRFLAAVGKLRASANA